MYSEGVGSTWAAYGCSRGTVRRSTGPGGVNLSTKVCVLLETERVVGMRSD